MTNAEIAAALDELGVLYELDGAVKYRVLAYGTAAKAIRESPVSVAELAAAGRATEIPGVGKTLAEKIDALLETGEIPAAVKLKAKFPPTLIEVTRVPGLGAKTARRLFDELGVATLEDLKEAAEGERIREVKGLGPKVEENVLAALERLGEPGEASGRVLLSKARPIAEELARTLREHPGRQPGRGRRLGAALGRDLQGHRPDRHRRGAGGAGRAPRRQPADRRRRQTGARTASGPRPTTGSRSTCGSSPPRPSATCSSTSPAPQAHNVQLREDAVGRGLSVSEHGITEVESGEVELCASEEAVYERLGYAYIEPELREGRGELKAAREGKLPELVAVDDIRGDLHSHTTLSDGRNTLEEMAEAGRERGYAYMAITDHSASHGFGDHVTAERLWERIEEIARLEQGQARLPPARRLRGQHRPRRLARLPRRPARGARLGRRQRPHLLRDLRAGDDRAGPGRDREPAGRLHRPPHRPPDRPPRALRDRRRGGGRGGGADRHDARDQRQPQPPRPLRAPRPPRRAKPA